MSNTDSNLPAATSSNSDADVSLTSGSAPSLTSTNTALPTLTTASIDTLSTSASSSGKTASPSSGNVAPTDLPTISTNTNNPLGLPTLPGGYNYPAPTVPPTEGAPYLNSSSLPQDFVFIVVGSVIALFVLLVLSYRIFVAWSANRSTKRAATANYHQLDYKHKMTESSHDLHSYPVRPSTGASIPAGNMPGNGSLFFSPTAAAAGGMRNSASNMNLNHGRGSTYLSSGYYGAGTTVGSSH